MKTKKLTNITLDADIGTHTVAVPSHWARLLDYLKRAEGVVSNVSWMMVSEVMARASRLITIITLASVLSAADYGYAMLALVCHELMRIFTRIGSGARLIQCDTQDLPRLAGNAYTLNWLICLTIAGLQFFLAPLIAAFYDSPALITLLRIMAISYLIYPIVAIKVHLLQRNNQMKFYSLASGLSVTVDNLSTALLVWFGCGIEAVAYAKILAALTWVSCFAFAKTLSVIPQCSLVTMLSLTSFSCRVLASELLRSLRTQADLLIAGRFLSPELFGLYSFAKSAGVGLAQSLGNAFLAGVYPRLANYHRNGQMAVGSKLILSIAAVVAIVFVMQSLAAPFYVPILFDAQWHAAAGLVAILCLSAVPALLLDTSALIARVEYKLNTEMLMQFIALTFLVVGLLVCQPESPQQFALASCLLSSSWLLVCVVRYIQLKPLNSSLLGRAAS